jgi:hypothetical protein
MGCEVEIFNLRAEVLAAAFRAPPAMELIDTIDNIPKEYYLTGLVLTSTMLNFSTTKEMGVFFVIGQTQEVVTFSEAIRSPISHVTLQNSLTGPPIVPVPTTKTTPLPLPQPILIRPRVPLSLYVFGDTTASNRLLAYLSVQMVRAS